MSDLKEEVAGLQSEIEVRDRHIGDHAGALNEVKVAPQFMSAAIHAPRQGPDSVVRAVARTALRAAATTRFIKDWATSEDGRAYVLLFAEQGSGTITREQFDRLPPVEGRAARTMKIVTG